jgi:hypothetical protein
MPDQTIRMGASAKDSSRTLAYVKSPLAETAFAKYADSDQFKEVEITKDKYLVVAQDPDPGELVPPGTPINITLKNKSGISTGAFRQMAEPVVKKYNTVGDFLTVLEKPEAGAAKEVIDKDKEYANLSAGDLEAVNSYINATYGVDPQAEPEKAKEVYDTARFYYHM